MQFAANVTNDVKDDFLMMMPWKPMMAKSMRMIPTTMKTMNYNNHQSNATASTCSNPPPLLQYTVDAANDVDNDFPLMLPTTTTMLMTAKLMITKTNRLPSGLTISPNSWRCPFSWCNTVAVTAPLFKPIHICTSPASGPRVTSNVRRW